MNVGVRELKQHLSEYLRRVAEGETLHITDRGKPVAVIAPVALGDPLSRGVEEGWIRPAVGSGQVGHHRRSRSTRRVLDVVREDRGE